MGWKDALPNWSFSGATKALAPVLAPVVVASAVVAGAMHPADPPRVECGVFETSREAGTSGRMAFDFVMAEVDGYPGGAAVFGYDGLVYAFPLEDLMEGGNGVFTRPEEGGALGGSLRSGLPHISTLDMRDIPDNSQAGLIGLNVHGTIPPADLAEQNHELPVGGVIAVDTGEFGVRSLHFTWGREYHEGSGELGPVELFIKVNGVLTAIPSNAIPSNWTLPDGAIPSNAIPSNAIPSNAIPSNAIPSNAIPSNLVVAAIPSNVMAALPASATSQAIDVQVPSSDAALPASALPSSALPASAIPAEAIPSNLLGQMGLDAVDPAALKGVLALPASALPASALPASAIPSNLLDGSSALPASALPASALPASLREVSGALPASFVDDQLGGAIPAEFTDFALPASVFFDSNLVDFQAIPSNQTIDIAEMMANAGALDLEDFESELAPGRGALDLQPNVMTTEFAESQALDPVVVNQDVTLKLSIRHRDRSVLYRFSGNSFDVAVASCESRLEERFGDEWEEPVIAGTDLRPPTLCVGGRYYNWSTGQHEDCGSVIVRDVPTRDGTITVAADPEDSTEVCDGVDNDQDGLVDEGLSCSDDPGEFTFTLGPEVPTDTRGGGGNPPDDNDPGVEVGGPTTTTTTTPGSTPTTTTTTLPSSNEQLIISSVDVYPPGQTTIEESYVFNGSQQCNGPFTTEIDLWVDRTVNGSYQPSGPGDIQSANLTWSVGSSVGSKPMGYVQTDLWSATLGPFNTDTVSSNAVLQVTVYLTSNDGVTMSGSRSLTLRNCELAVEGG